jgi:hypothetical protein
MSDIAWSSWITASYNIQGGQIFWLTSDPFTPGFNVFSSISLSEHRVITKDPHIVRARPSAWAYIYAWTVFTPDGKIQEIKEYTYSNAAWIDNVHTITYALYVSGGCSASTQISIFIR